MRLKQPTDDRILQDLSEYHQDVPGNIAERIDRHPTYVSDRIQQLTDYGLIDHVGRSVYRLSDKGEAYLRGEIDVSELED